MTSAAKSPYAGYRFPGEIISHAVWLYFRFPLSLRMVEEMLAARGCVARIEAAGAMTPTPACSGNADVGRASQLQHAVEDMDRHVPLGGPSLLCVRAQPVPDH